MNKFDVLVIGGGISGIQTALDVADKGYSTLIVEKEPSIGGKMIQLSKVFPTLDCASCITTPKMSSSVHHDNITVWTYSEVDNFEKTADGTFLVSVHKKSRFVTDACTGCRSCETACPVEVPSEFEMGLSSRKAIYIPFQTAIPQKAVLDLDNCIACGLCYSTCPANAIDFSLQDENVTIQVDSIVLATGFELTPLGEKKEWGSGQYTNVISSLAMERLLAPNGPYQGVRRPSDGKVPMRIAWIQCAGSRDASLGRTYCSRVCCMYAIKQAMLTMGSLPVVGTTIYYMDIRAFGKGYEQFYQNAKAMGVEFVKGKVGEIKEDPQSKNLTLVVEKIEEGGGKIEEEYDLVVLSLGLTTSICSTAGLPVEKDSDGFIKSVELKLNPVRTSEDGIFGAGTAMGPKDIVDSIIEGSAAAVNVTTYLHNKKLQSSKEFEIILPTT